MDLSRERSAFKTAAGLWCRCCHVEAQNSAPHTPSFHLFKALAESHIAVLPGPPESGTECGWCSYQEVAQWILTLVGVLAWEEASVLWSCTHKDSERQM